MTAAARSCSKVPFGDISTWPILNHGILALATRACRVVAQNTVVQALSKMSAITTWSGMPSVAVAKTPVGCSSKAGEQSFALTNPRMLSGLEFKARVHGLAARGL